MHATIAAMSEIPTDSYTQAQWALHTVVDEIEQGAASLGWDRPPALYAIVRTEELLNTPDLPEDVAQGLHDTWDGSSSHLSAVLQESLGEDHLEEVLPQIAWPESVYGAALTVERLIAPPEVEAQAPTDPEEAIEFISNHPLSADVRLTIGVTRDGDSWCEVRTRAFDDIGSVGRGVNLVPSLVEGLKLGFATDEPNADVPAGSEAMLSQVEDAEEDAAN